MPRTTVALSLLSFLMVLAERRPPEQQVPVWRLERISSTSVDPERPQVGGLAAHRDGSAFVLDARNQQIVVYDSLGRRVRAIGRRGEGPLEFTGLRQIAWLGDTLVAHDFRQSRLTFIQPNGTLTRTVPWVRQLRVFQLYGAGGGALYAGVTTVPVLQPGAPAPPPAPGPPRSPFVAVGPTGTTTGVGAGWKTLSVETGAVCWKDPSGDMYGLGFGVGGVGPWGTMTSTGKFARPNAERDRIELHGASGIASVSTTSYVRIPVTDSIWTRDAKEYLDLVKLRGPVTCNPPVQRPRDVPAIRGLYPDDAGNVWVNVTTPTGFRLDVYDADAKLIATADPPTRDEGAPFIVRAGRLYVVERDRDDVQSVAIYRIRR